MMTISRFNPPRDVSSDYFLCWCYLSLELPSRKSGKLEGKMIKEKAIQFRDELYGVFKKRADASQELIDALASAARVESPVSLSLSEAFRRGFSSV